MTPKATRVVKRAKGASRTMIFTPKITPCSLHYYPLGADGSCAACQRLHPKGATP